MRLAHSGLATKQCTCKQRCLFVKINTKLCMVWRVRGRACGTWLCMYKPPCLQLAQEFWGNHLPDAEKKFIPALVEGIYLTVQKTK